MAEILKLDPERPEQSVLKRAAAILRDGGVIAFPTETFYGLGADGENREAIEKIFFIKGRTFTKAIPIIIGHPDDVLRLTKTIPEAGKRLIDRFWPGALTLLLEAASHVSERLTAGTGKIGIRLSSNIIATELARALGQPLTATSANISGMKECSTAEEVLADLGNAVDAVIDGGKTPGGKGSTIVDVTMDPPTVVREGVIATSLIFDTLRKT